MPRGSVTAEASIAPRTLIVANLGLVTMIFFWGSFFPVMEQILKGWDPLSATAGRHLTAAAALTAVALAAERRLPFRRDLPWMKLFLLGSVGFVLSSICMSLSVLWSSGVAAAIVSATNPISAAITARLLFGMSLGRGILFGAALAVAGSGIAILGAGTAFGEFDGFRGGELLVIVANVAWTWFSLAAQRWLRGASQLDISLLTTVPGALCMTLVTVAAGGVGLVELRIDLAPEYLLPVLYTGTVPIAIGNFLWHFGVSRIGIAVSSMYTNLIPVTAALVAFVWIGTQPTLYQLVGGAIIIAGVFYAQVTALRSERR
ncbi:MAG: membrane protein [Alphaproteobacteria bacterium]|nr:MAG: membrane protein [Alphaproteobacteria bacterium]